MSRREARLRREYLFKKANEAKKASQHETKASLVRSLKSGTPVPADLRSRDPSLAKTLTVDEHDAVSAFDPDDEYSNAPDTPKIVVTTSRDPSNKLLEFVKEISQMIPNCQRINRGSLVVSDVVSTCKSNGVTDLLIVHEHRGVPNGLVLSHLPHGPTCHFSLHNVVTRHDLPIGERGTISEAYPHLIVHNFRTKIGIRISRMLQFLFPKAKDSTKRVITFSNDLDYISVRHHIYRTADKGEIQLAEMGPRFELRPYHVVLGTVDITEAETEWHLPTFTNTFNKRTFL